MLVIFVRHSTTAKLFWIDLRVAFSAMRVDIFINKSNKNAYLLFFFGGGGGGGGWSDSLKHQISEYYNFSNIFFIYANLSFLIEVVTF